MATIAGIAQLPYRGFTAWAIYPRQQLSHDGRKTYCSIALAQAYCNNQAEFNALLASLAKKVEERRFEAISKWAVPYHPECELGYTIKTSTYADGASLPYVEVGFGNELRKVRGALAMRSALDASRFESTSSLYPEKSERAQAYSWADSILNGEGGLNLRSAACALLFAAEIAPKSGGSQA